MAFLINFLLFFSRFLVVKLLHTEMACKFVFRLILTLQVMFLRLIYWRFSQLRGDVDAKCLSSPFISLFLFLKFDILRKKFIIFFFFWNMNPFAFSTEVSATYRHPVLLSNSMMFSNQLLHCFQSMRSRS